MADEEDLSMQLDEQDQQSNVKAKKKKGKKQRDTLEEDAWRLSDYTDRVAVLHHNQIKLDERKVFGQVTLHSPLPWLLSVHALAAHTELMPGLHNIFYLYGESLLLCSKVSSSLFCMCYVLGQVH